MKSINNNAHRQSPYELFNLEGKVAVVTVGTGILGGEMAKGLLQAGAGVVFLAATKKILIKSGWKTETVKTGSQG
jgi:NAD(P)-dependent dehydrogenase (short-subunit alcohol dehydrogenase family)